MTVDEWMSIFAKCVRERDYAMARGLVSRNTYSFGTVVNVAVGRGELEYHQWCVVWPVTHGFKWTEWPEWMILDLDTDVVVAACWTSFQGDVERRGRATIVLQRTDDDMLEAVHTHFSIEPTRKDQP